MNWAPESDHRLESKLIMPSPFPGIDPYLESQGYWSDFHASLILYCRDALNDILPESYEAQTWRATSPGRAEKAPDQDRASRCSDPGRRARRKKDFRHALLSRGDRRPQCDVFAWSVRQPLPRIPIPLRAPEADVMLDLPALVALGYERGRYARAIDHSAPLDLPLASADRAWAEVWSGRGSREDVPWLVLSPDRGDRS